MRFTPKEDIKKKSSTFEADNVYESDKYDFLNDDDVHRWREAGLCEIEGAEPAPARNMAGVTVTPHNARHAQTAED